MKLLKKCLLASACTLMITGCGQKTSPVSPTSKVLQSAVESADNESANSTAAAIPAPLETTAPVEALPESNFSVTETTTETSDNSIDYDLTLMGSDMVYATVYQMMVDPETYIGKTFRITGTYYPVYVDATGKYYHYCIIQDATACCAQGMEFVWDDGSHVYPDEYPEENAEITVTGTFETYQEENDQNLYCRLIHATLEFE